MGNVVESGQPGELAEDVVDADQPGKAMENVVEPGQPGEPAQDVDPDQRGKTLTVIGSRWRGATPPFFNPN